MKPRKLLQKLTEKQWLLQLCDSCLCLLLFFPSMVFYWRGIWDLFGVYIYPGDAPKCHWVTTGIGACSIVGYFLQPLLSHILSKVQSKVIYVIVTRLYLVGYGILTMAYWRGVWSVADFYLLEYGWKAGVIGLFISHAILFCLKASRTTIFPPFTVTLDTRDDLLVPSTFAATPVVWSKPLSVCGYAVESLITHFVIMTATIVTWRSSLNILDQVLLPDNWLNSNLLSFGAGVAGSIVLFAIETPLALLGKKIRSYEDSFWLTLLYEDAVYFIVFAVECLLWRGAWNLNVLYIISDPMVGGWVNHAVGVVLLMSLQLYTYASACGCAYDGKDQTSGDAIYATKYLRHYLQSRKQNITEIVTIVTSPPTDDNHNNNDVTRVDLTDAKEYDSIDDGIYTISNPDSCNSTDHPGHVTCHVASHRDNPGFTTADERDVTAF